MVSLAPEYRFPLVGARAGLAASFGGREVACRLRARRKARRLDPALLPSYAIGFDAVARPQLARRVGKKVTRGAGAWNAGACAASDQLSAVGR
jgi:hypothetical protein